MLIPSLLSADKSSIVIIGEHEMRSLIKSIDQFYRHDCCWPYAVSFYLTLIIYWFDFFVANSSRHWASPVAYGILLAYFLYIIHLFLLNKLENKNRTFFVGFLSFKVIVWGSVLLLLYGIR